jgi:CTP:molybdopterin cytidylyltransferase MocA
VKIAAVVLAAGRSERFGRLKPLLPAGATTFLGAILDTLATCRVDEVRVVLGHGAEEVKTALGLPEAVYTVNLNYDAGMLSSVRAGIHALPPDLAGFFLWPVDHPLVRAATIDLLVDAFANRGSPIVLPSHHGRRGHPVLFGAGLAPELVASADSVGARQVVHAHASEVLEVPVEDSGVVTDIDTPQAYEEAFGRPPDPR